jgi:hypothetical protein
VSQANKQQQAEHGGGYRALRDSLGLGDPEYGVPAAFIDSAVVVEQGQFHP